MQVNFTRKSHLPLVVRSPFMAILRILCITLFLFLNVNLSLSQDTVKVMHYNLLNYGNITGYCNTSNNSIDEKDIWLKEILKYVQPDILTVNEIAANTYVHQRLLDSTLNIDGINVYGKAVYSNLAGSGIVNMLYYDTTKFVLQQQDVVQPVSIRDINIYKLYYRSDDLSITHDTVFLYCIVAHLKAGNSSEDAAKRAVMTNGLMNYLNNNYEKCNFVFAGDYNTYTSSEAAYQNLINYPDADYRFYDPINRPGNWNNNSSFADIHTQSTHSSSNGCASGGGMDDRFDQILVSQKIINGADKIEYVQGSYNAVGQDGLHFNNSINATPVNTSVPPDVLNALYYMSDHLPVTLELKISAGSTSFYDRSMNKIYIEYENPVNDILNVRYEPLSGETLIIEIFSGQGLQMKNISWKNTDNIFSIDLRSFPKGIYIIMLRDSSGNFSSSKFIKI